MPIRIKARGGETAEQILRRFKKLCEKEGLTKDMKRRAQFRVPSPDREQKMCEVGDGNLNWARILEACRSAGVRWFLVERDQGDLDPFDSLQRSLENMQGMGLH